MAWTEADRDNLKAALATGVKKARIGAEEVEYASTSDMLRVLNLMDQELASSSGFSVSYPNTGRGL